MITSQSGEVVVLLASGTQEVDKTQFVKLYVNGVKAFRELTAAGAKCLQSSTLKFRGKLEKTGCT